jgi:hypothetical protein
VASKELPDMHWIELSVVPMKLSAQQKDQTRVTVDGVTRTEGACRLTVDGVIVDQEEQLNGLWME